MASNKSLKKFCKLSKYIEQTDPSLFKVFDDLCIMHYLKPARGASGITFLFPKEKAYRQKIINAAYSTEPDVAVNMIKALVLQDYYPTFASFGDKAVNLLNQKLEIAEVSEKHLKLANGLELTVDKLFVPMGYRDNMTVYTLSGKGELSLTAPVAVVKHSEVKKGGSSSVASKLALHKLLENTYIGEIGKVDNIYVKKVYLQLKCLLEHKDKLDQSVMQYLGNDEFSDSYLLDMHCEKHHPECFDLLLKCLSPNTYESNVSRITKDLYIKMKEALVGTTANISSVKDPRRLEGIQSPMEIRLRVFKLYNNDKHIIGKDLFIVFCNICRDMWKTDADKVGAFKNFAYIACNVYTNCTDIVKQEFDIAQDLTLYGNLLKSDVFMFAPQACFTADKVNLPIPSSLPSPLDMSLYSLCGFINVDPVKVTTGGDHAIGYLLGDI